MAKSHLGEILHVMRAGRLIEPSKHSIAHLCQALADHLKMPEYHAQALRSIVNNRNLAAFKHAQLRKRLLVELRRAKLHGNLAPATLALLQSGIGQFARLSGFWQLLMVVPTMPNYEGHLIRQSLLHIDDKLNCTEIGPSTKFSGWALSLSPTLYVNLGDENKSEESKIVFHVNNPSRKDSDLDFAEGLRVGVYKTRLSDHGVMYATSCLIRKLKILSDLDSRLLVSETDDLRKYYCHKFFSNNLQSATSLKPTPYHTDVYKSIISEDMDIGAKAEQGYGIQSLVDRLLDRPEPYITIKRDTSKIGTDPVQVHQS